MSLNVSYLDAGIWIAYGLGKKDPFYNSSKELIENKLGQDKHVGIVSVLSILESIETIRRRITERLDPQYLKRAGNEQLRTQIVQSLTEPKIQQLAVYLTEMESQTKLLFADFQRVNINDIINKVHDFEKTYFGVVREYSKCGICRTPFLNYSYKGLGFIDMLHINLAYNLRCTDFYTTDQYYNHIKDLAPYNSLKFHIFTPEYYN